MKLGRRSQAVAPRPMNPLREIQNNHKSAQLLTIPTHSGRKRTLIVHAAKSFRPTPPAPGNGGQRKRHVRFNAQENRTYDNRRILTPEDCKRLWYSPTEIRIFQRHTREWLQDVRTSHPLYASWSSTLHRVYHAFCTYDSAKDVLSFLDKAPRVFHPSGLGMERRAVSLVSEDTISRRRQIYAHVKRCQKAPIPDPWLRAQMIREMSRTLSKPSRLYARHVAHMSAISD